MNPEENSVKVDFVKTSIKNNDEMQTFFGENIPGLESRAASPKSPKESMRTKINPDFNLFNFKLLCLVAC